jgi:hypothetical protein
LTLREGIWLSRGVLGFQSGRIRRLDLPPLGFESSLQFENLPKFLFRPVFEGF